jgi:hypothetical protein
MRRSPSAGPVPAAERAWHRRWRSYSSTWSPTGSSCTAAVTGPRPVPWSRPTNGTTASTWPPSETLIGLPSLGCPSNMVVATPIASVGDRHTEAVAHLRGVLHTVVDNRSGTDAVDRIGWRAGAVLYLLLRDHPINRWGRCRSCRYTGTIIGFRRRRCRVHITANYWLLRQPDEVLLLSHLADRLQLASGCGHLGRAPRPARRRKWRKRGDAGSYTMPASPMTIIVWGGVNSSALSRPKSMCQPTSQWRPRAAVARAAA